MRNRIPLLLIALFLATALCSAQDNVRKVVHVPKVDPAAITLDGKMDEPAWQTAAQANLVTATGFEIWASKYYRDAIPEPEFDELYGRMLWADDTLYVFMHIDEFVNDSTNLFFGGKSGNTPGSTHWQGDQLYIGLSNRFGVVPIDEWEGGPWASPDGPYMLMIMGDRVTFNDGDSVWVPDQHQKWPGDSVWVYNASDIARWGATMDTTTGVWNVEMAIYHPNVRSQSAIAFNIGGSTGSRDAYYKVGDAYGYYTWQPNVPDDPWAAPTPDNWNSFYIQRDSRYWSVLNMSDVVTGVTDPRTGEVLPSAYQLSQNYPNPFNPSTSVRFDLPQGAKVSVTVHNVLGQKVATLFDGYRPAGSYTATWNAGGMSSGMYFLQMHVDGKLVSVKKMVLMK